MKKKLFITLFYLIIFFNSNLFSEEKRNQLKIGLLAPLSGEYKELGNSLLHSIQLALDEIGDKNIFVIPRDSGFRDKEKINEAIKDLKLQNIKIIIGPISHQEFSEVKKYSDIVFISPSNISPEFSDNVISVGISLESQLISLINFIKKQKKKRTIIMYPKNEYAAFIEKKLKGIDFQAKTFSYSSNPQVLTGEIENFTNYAQRKRNLDLRKKIFEDKEDEESLRELERLEQLYTLGEVNFDSVIIIDFGNSLKSVLTSLVYTDVNESKVLFTTVNQWFDESIFYENTIKRLYYPSINFKEFKKYNENYFKKFKSYPSEITILTYDALGLIYYAWKQNKNLNSINNFSFKNKIKGKIGTFSINERRVVQELEIYRVEKNKFTKF
tara:strand:+ start:2771 stop:3922 length:1152 start_codon:yes stop_codon:yes gene_type:complete